MALRLVGCAILAATALLSALLALPSPAYSHKPITTNILFKNEIAQIFQRKCFQCHSDSNLAMSLTTYSDARPWARAIREEVLERRMPPWTAVPGYGHFSNDLGLSQRELDIILSWTDGGAPSGVLKAEEPIPPVYVPLAPDWDHGVPDKVLAIGNGHVVEAGAPVVIKRFIVPTKLSTAANVRAIALKQGDRRIVRHAAFYEETTGRWLGSWTPWQTAMLLPTGIVHRLPAGARLVVDIGYSGTEEAVTDRSELGLYFEKAGAAATTGLKISGPPMPLAAGATAQRSRAEIKLTSAASVLALWPDSGPGARSIEITATTPDGLVTPLLWVKNYRPEWRSPYVLSSPVALPLGTRVLMTTYFDNPAGTAARAEARAWLIVAPK